MKTGRRQALRALMWAGGALSISGVAISGVAGLMPRAIAVPLAGVISFAVYRDFEPWAWRDKDGRLTGVDVDLAGLLARAMGARADVQEWIPADDVDGDLRNAVWRGSLLGRPPADVLMHVPVDHVLMQRNDRVVIGAAYCREGFAMACNDERVEDCEAPLAAFKGHPLAAEIDTVPDIYLTSVDGGVLRGDVKHFMSGSAAVAAVAAVAGQDADAVVATRAQIEHGMAAAPGRLIQRKAGLPGMMSPGWNVGLAVKRDNQELAEHLASVMTQLITQGQVAALFEHYGLVYRPPADSS